MKNKIYSLGGGCATFSNIPTEYRVEDCIFSRGFLGDNYEKFWPLLWFNGEYNYEKFIKNIEFNEIDCERYKNCCDIRLKSWNCRLYHAVSFQYHLSKSFWDKCIDYFNIYKYDLCYIIDFTNGMMLYDGYSKSHRGFKNEHLLEFELYLKNNNFDYNKFIYLTSDYFEKINPNFFTNTCIECIVLNKKYDMSGIQWYNPVKELFEDKFDYIKNKFKLS